MNKPKKHGFVLGKFMPPHRGHEHLFRVAENMSDFLTILVCSLPGDPIPGTLRRQWVSEMIPRARVVHLKDSIPQEPKDHPSFWNIWKSAIRGLVPQKIDYVFASEHYGWRLAEELTAEHIPVDRMRNMVPTSGTDIRTSPMQNWKHIPEVVRPHYVKRVAVVGPESVGKSTLVTMLAEHFHTTGVEEYARQLFDGYVEAGLRKPGQFLYKDLSVVARGQIALEKSLARFANKILITDTDALTTLTWSQYLYGKNEPWLFEAAKNQHYDLTLLLHPLGTAYVADGQRVMEDYAMRATFTDMLKQNLRKIDRPYVELRGTYDERFEHAKALIGNLQ